jgi:hypothetical protein
MRWGNAGVTSLNHIMDTVTKKFLTFEKIKTLIKNKNFIQYYTIISNIPTDIKKYLKDNIDNINTGSFPFVMIKFFQPHNILSSLP